MGFKFFSGQISNIYDPWFLKSFVLNVFQFCVQSIFFMCVIFCCCKYFVLSCLMYNASSLCYIFSMHLTLFCRLKNHSLNKFYNCGVIVKIKKVSIFFYSSSFSYFTISDCKIDCFSLLLPYVKSWLNLLQFEHRMGRIIAYYKWGRVYGSWN